MRHNLSITIRVILVYLLLPLLTFFSAHAQRKAVNTANQVITTGFMQQSIGYLASDSLLGRDTPSPGLDSAASYIMRQFRSFGLKPLNGSFYQDLDYCYLELGPENLLSVSDGNQTHNFKIKTDFIPFDVTGDKTVEAPVVFAGYGITAPEYNYDDYEGMDVKGKIVLVLRQEPGQTDSTGKVFMGKESTRYSNLREKIKIAKDHGAIGMLVVSGPLNYTSLRPRGYPWPSLSKTLPRDALPIGICSTITEKIPVVHIGEQVVNLLLGNVDSLKKIQQGIEDQLKPNSFAIPGKVIAMKTTMILHPIGGRNVIGYLEGSHPERKKELVIIGGHYDHVGFIKEHKPDTDYIYNGADDNASGTSGVLAVAKAFTSMPERPDRSVLFIAFAGEEKGLLGSATYVKEPLLPLENTVAMINLDMISRNHPDSLEILGAKQNPDLTRIVRKQNKKIGMILKESHSNHMDGGSDHQSFYRKGIPDIFFFTDVHKDYHQVNDNPDRTDPEKAARVSRLVFLTAWYIANDTHRYKLIREEMEED